MQFKPSWCSFLLIYFLPPSISQTWEISWMRWTRRSLEWAPASLTRQQLRTSDFGVLSLSSVVAGGDASDPETVNHCCHAISNAFTNSKLLCDLTSRSSPCECDLFCPPPSTTTWRPPPPPPRRSLLLESLCSLSGFLGGLGRLFDGTSGKILRRKAPLS